MHCILQSLKKFYPVPVEGSRRRYTFLTLFQSRKKKKIRTFYGINDASSGRPRNLLTRNFQGQSHDETRSARQPLEEVLQEGQSDSGVWRGRLEGNHYTNT